MRTNFILLLILAISASVTFFVCSNSAAPSDPDTDSYMPLKINNTWNYSTDNSGFKRTTKIIRTVVVNSKEYFLLSTLNHENAVDTIRMVNNKIYKITNKAPVLWIDLDAADNGQYNYMGYTVSVRRNTSVNTKAGSFNNCIDVFFDVPQIADEEHGYTFAKGVGIVNMYSAWFSFKLESYSLKGFLNGNP